MQIITTINGYACLSTDLKYPEKLSIAPKRMPENKTSMNRGSRAAGMIQVTAEMNMDMRHNRTIHLPHAIAG